MASTPAAKNTPISISMALHNNRMQSDFGKLRLPQPLMRALCGSSK